MLKPSTRETPKLGRSPTARANDYETRELANNDYKPHCDTFPWILSLHWVFLSSLNKWKTINNHETYSKSFEENNKKFVEKTVLS